MKPKPRIFAFAAVVSALALAGCGDDTKVERVYPEKDPLTGRYVVPGQQQDMPQRGINLLDFGGGESADNIIGVNRFLWHASLDVLSALPLASVDPYGGVLISEWLVTEENHDERTRVIARIRGIDLTASALDVNVYRQTRNDSGDWVGAGVADTTARSIADSILTRARQNRIEENSG